MMLYIIARPAKAHAADIWRADTESPDSGTEWAILLGVPPACGGPLAAEGQFIQSAEPSFFL